MDYGHKKEVNLSFEDAVKKAREELSKEGFGVLTEINVKETLKKKLDIEHDDYIILGACNPSLAHKALSTEKDIGLMLPCNMIVYRNEGKTYAAVISPIKQMEKVGNPDLKNVAPEVEEKMKRVLENI